MALAEGAKGGSAAPPRKKKRRDEYEGSDGSRAPVSKPKPAKPAPVRPPTHAYTPAPVTPYVPTHDRPYVFDRISYPGANIFDLNKRVEIANAAFMSQFGFEPSPGLLLDIVRGPMANEDLVDMFKIPLSFANAEAQAQSRLEPQEVISELEKVPVMQGLRDAINRDAPGRTENYETFVKSNAEELNEIANSFPTGEFEFVVERYRAQRNTEQGLPTPTQEYLPPGQDPEMSGFGEALYFGAKATGQVAESLVYAPAGIYEMGKALGFDLRDAVRDEDPSFKRSREMGSAVIEAVKSSYADPLENPGYIFMDAFGLLSGGAGAASRFSRAATAARTAGGTRGVLNALSHRALPGTDEIGGEFSLLSQNAAVSPVQRLLNERRRQALDKRRKRIPEEFAPLPHRHSLGKLQAEGKVGREAAARQRVERELAMEPVRELKAVAGWSINSSRAFSRMPKAMRQGLSRGEQKAIQVLLTDEPGGWEAQLSLHQRFHERMIDEGVGNPREHQRQLADLELAKRALQNPRKRFDDAVELVREVSREGELLKIERLGLDADGARRRIAANAEVLRTGQVVDTDAPIPLRDPDSRYLPSVRSDKAFQRTRQRIGGLRPGRYGVPPPRNLPELTHQFTGNSILWGDTRIDATNLAGESYGRAVRLAASLDEHKRLWEVSTEKKMSEWDIPIRSTATIPDELRKVVNAGESAEGALTKRQVDALGPDFQKSLYQHLYPETKAPDTRWVDSRYLGDVWRYPDEPGTLTKMISAINEPLRATTLFLRPAYGVGNVLGNTGMLLMQSLGAPNNLRKAYQINKRYGERNARTIADLVSEGKSLSFAPEDLVQTKISRTLAHGWNALVDRKFREASFIHWAEKMGYADEAAMTKLLDAKSTDKKVLKDRVEITRRAKKDMVEFDNLTPFEKNTMRHLVFVYPWVSRSILWSLRTMVEHPIKTWTLTQLGRVGEDKVEDVIGEQVPDWVTSSGYFPMFKDDDGTPRIVNPSSFNTFSGLNEIRRTGEALVNQTPYAGPEDFTSPALEWLMNLWTGRDQFGISYDNRLKEASLDVLEGLPQSPLVKKLIGKEEKVDPDASPSERPSFIRDGWMDYLGPLVVGGFWPRTPDEEALAADWLRDQPEETRNDLKVQERAKAIKDRLAAEKRVILDAEKYNAQILGRPIPADVKDAIELQLRFMQRYTDLLLERPYSSDGSVKDNPENLNLGVKGWDHAPVGRTLTALERRIIQVRTLYDLNRIPEDTYVELSNEAIKAANKGEITQWGTQFDKDYLHADALRSWWDDRDEVLDVATNAQVYMNDLRRQGLYKGGSGKPKQEDLLEVGRQYVDFRHELTARAEDTGARSDLVTLDNSLDRAWMDEQDKPINIDGKTFPSPARMAWAMRPAEERLGAIADLTVASWDTLSDFEKELVGKKVPSRTSFGWVVLNSIMDGFRGNVGPRDVEGITYKDPDTGKQEPLADLIPDAFPPNERSIEREHKLKLAKWVDKYFVPGFYKDVLFQMAPKYQRMRVLPMFTKGPTSERWKEVFRAANEQFSLIARSRARDYKVPYTITSVQEKWDAYAKNTLYPFLQENASDEFKKELELLGGVDLLRTLIADG